MNKISASLAMAFSLLMISCSGGDDLDDSGCDGSCADSATTPPRLETTDVERILVQAILEAQAQSTEATIAISDRVGNILAVYRMGDAATRVVQLATQLDDTGTAVIDSGLEGIILPTTERSDDDADGDGNPDDLGNSLNIDDQAAISKAITGAYLSSEGNAFSTRTAGQIIQENFNPGEQDQPSGPLFGVQFSQLSCSDFTEDSITVSQGPKRAPLGLSADPGGFPLYKAGTLVGGIGVIADGLYSIDRNISDIDYDIDEIIALAGTVGFSAPENRRAEQITVEGKTLRFSDATDSDVLSSASSSVSLSDISSTGSLIAVTGYVAPNADSSLDPEIRQGTAFGQPESGIIAAEDSTGPQFSGLDAFVFVDSSSNNRYPAIDSPAIITPTTISPSEPLIAEEVQTILEEALKIANRARAQIRKPLGSQARVNIAVVDIDGVILGMVRSRDAPIFGADVAVQKARTATFYSSQGAGSFLSGQASATYFNVLNSASEPNILSLEDSIVIDDYVTATRSFAGAAALTGVKAYSDRAGGNISRPFYPDGLSGSPPGPLSKPEGSWSVFSTGIQLDLVFNGIIQHVLSVASNGAIADVNDQCTDIAFIPETLAFTAGDVNSRIANGIQIFPGSVPIYRGATLVGGIGISGDGVDQDDMIGFLGVHYAGIALNETMPAGVNINNASADIRADTLTPQGVRQRFIQCPQAPFLDSDEDNVCEGK